MIGIRIGLQLGDYTNYFLEGKMIRKELLELVREEAKEVRALYVSLMSNFTPKNRSPLRRKSGSGRSPVSGVPGSIYAAVGTNRLDGPLVWLEDGTKIRYRTMSQNWQSKTSPGGGISVRGGKGRALGFGIHAGIQARKFRDDIIDRRYPKFVTAGQIVFDNIFRKAGWY
jgi:hypothetical protein